MPTESFLDATEKELLTIANACLKKAGSALSEPDSNFDQHTKLRLLLEAGLCLKEKTKLCVLVEVGVRLREGRPRFFEACVCYRQELFLCGVQKAFCWHEGLIASAAQWCPVHLVSSGERFMASAGGRPSAT